MLSPCFGFLHREVLEPVGLRIARLQSLGLLAAVLLLANGCALFRRERPMRTPEGLDHFPSLLTLREEAVSDKALREAFPPLESLIANTRALARRRWILGKTYLDINMAAAPERRIRMAGYKIGDRSLLFDLVIAGEQMTVYTPLDRRLYRGQLPPEGSPFKTEFGVEPFDLATILTIGQRLSLSDPRPAISGKGTALIPGPDDAVDDGLRLARLEKESGLPKEAVWTRGGNEWKVEYLEWNLHPDQGSDPKPWLLPDRLIIRSRRPRVSIEIAIRQYRINPAEDPRRFQMAVPAGTTPGSLEDMQEGLKGL